MMRDGSTVVTLACGLCKGSCRSLTARRTSSSWRKEVCRNKELHCVLTNILTSVAEYVAAEKIENVLIGSPLIGQCFVYGDSFKTSLVAIVVPDEEPVRTWAADGSLSAMSFSELCASKELNDAIMNDIRDLSDRGGLHGFEKVKAVYLDPAAFTAENELVTPTFKLKRQKLRDHYQKQIDALYASLPAPKSKL